MFNFFRYNLDGLIDFPAGRAENVNDQDGYGMETDVVWDVTDKMDVKASYAWQHSKNSRTGETIANAPGHQATLALRYKVMDSCLVSPQAYWVGDRSREAADPRADIANYTLVDLTWRCDMRAVPVEWAASVRNAFNEDAREPSKYNALLGVAPVTNDYPLEGRSFYLEASYHFDD